MVKNPVNSDTDRAGTVNFTDLLTLAQHYGQLGTQWSNGHFNYEGTVNFADLLILAQNYGHSLSTPAAAAASADSTSLLLRKIRRGPVR